MFLDLDPNCCVLSTHTISKKWSVSHQVLKINFPLWPSPQEKLASEDSVEAGSARLLHANQCDQCDSSFKKPSDLARHLRYL
jgi:hypothetical protein